MEVIKRRILVALAVVALAGCSRDNSGYPVDGNEILFRLKMPEMTATRSTAIGAAETDYSIGHLDILVFEDKGGPGDLFMYAATPTSLQAYPGDPSIRTFSLALKKSANGEKQKLVVIANLKNQVQTLLSTLVPDPSAATTTKDELLSKLFFTHGDWMADYGGVPMWGESTGSAVVIQSTTGASFGTIDMLYSVAKVEVAVNAGAGYTEARGLDGFKMTYSGIYNTRTAGHAVPQAAANLSAGTVRFPSIPSHCAISPSVLSQSAGRTEAGFPVLYAAPRNIIEADNKNSEYGDCVYVIVGGYYTGPGQPENTDKITYYRIDFYDRTSNEPSANRLDILRGHRYMINITGVDGPGSDTPEEAAEAVPVIMNTEVIVWNANGIDVDFKGTQYYLTVSEKALTTGKDAGANLRFSVKTDVPAGYGIEITDSAEKEGNPLGWIRMLSDNAGTVTLGVDENLTAGPRTAYIHVTAGRLSNVVRVTQLNTQLLSLEVEPVYEMVFTNHRGTMSPIPAPAQTLSIAWNPEHLPVNITKVATLDGGVDFAVGGTFNGGQAGISIQPGSMSGADVAADVFREKASRLDIELEGHDGARIMKSVYVRQKSYGVKQLTNPDRYYSMISGATGTVTIAVNSPWYADITGGAVAGVNPSSGGGNTTGQVLTFSMNQGTPNSTAVISSKIVIKSLLGVFPDYEIDINAVWGWVYDAQSGAGHHDATGIYVATQSDPSDSPSKYVETSCPSGWKIPAINGIRGLWNFWGYSPQVRRQANFTEGGNYWSSTDGSTVFDKHTKRFDDTGTEDQAGGTLFSPTTRPYRCVRAVTTSEYPNAR